MHAPTLMSQDAGLDADLLICSNITFPFRRARNISLLSHSLAYANGQPSGAIQGSVSQFSLYAGEGHFPKKHRYIEHAKQTQTNKCVSTEWEKRILKLFTWTMLWIDISTWLSDWSHANTSASCTAGLWDECSQRRFANLMWMYRCGVCHRKNIVVWSVVTTFFNWH